MQEFVPEAIANYAEAHTSPESPIFRALAEDTFKHAASPQMQVGLVEGMFLKLLAKAIGAKRILEIGTFTGYSTLMMAEGLPEDGVVITCDIDPAVTAMAEKHWRQSPHGSKITLKLGHAKKTLKTLAGPFDMIFIDADKQNYIYYWDTCLPMVRSGGVILADNVLWSGRVLDPQEADDHAMVAFNNHVKSDARVEAVVLTIRDGITMAWKR